MATPQFSFGDFTEEEHKNLLRQPTCVEFPWEGLPLANSHEAKLVGKESSWEAGNQLLKDENHNDVQDEARWKSGNCQTKLEAAEFGTAFHKEGIHKPAQYDIKEKTEIENVIQPGNLVKTKPPKIDPDEETKQSTSDNIEGISRNNTLVNGHCIDEPDQPSSEVEEVIVNEHTPGIMAKDAVVAPENASKEQISSEPGLVKSSLNGPTPEFKDDAAISGNNQTAASKAAGKSSWASLFTGQVPGPKPVEAGKVPAGAPPKDAPQKKKPVIFNGMTPKPAITTKVVDLKDDPFSRQIAEQIRRNEIVYRSPGLLPRGFVNSSNWCYINATLQALLNCSPFCHLMRSFPSRPVSADSNVLATSTPILDSFVRLVKELKPLPKRNPQRNSKDFGGSHEPDYVYKMLSVIKSNLSEQGRQEDAEEFLSCVLNGLHEEMLKLTDHHFGKVKPADKNDEVFVNNSQTELGYDVPVHEEDPVDDPNEHQEQWEEVHTNRKNRNSVTRRGDISKTLVSDVFRGELRSDLFQEGQRSTATLEPFFTLQLDINDQSTWSVNEALEHLTRMDMVQDFTNSKTKAKVEATRRQTLETLPPVLILHLKRFIYDKGGGSLKLDKEIQYHTDLIIGKELLSKSAKKIAQERRSYKLFAVVYHHGKKSTGGHYTTDVYHDGLNCWLRIDDQHIKPTNVHEVVRHNPQRTAYLLYYKRTDLMSV